MIEFKPHSHSKIKQVLNSYASQQKKNAAVLTSIRNPYDRLVSAYLYIIQYKKDKRNKELKFVFDYPTFVDFCMDISMNPFWKTKNPDYDLIHIHWPEALFNWKEVSKEDIEKLKARLQELKKQGKKIVVTRHNSIPHRRAENDRELYEASFSFADAVFHMEQYCRDEYDKFYKHAFDRKIAERI